MMGRVPGLGNLMPGGGGMPSMDQMSSMMSPGGGVSSRATKPALSRNKMKRDRKQQRQNRKKNRKR